MHEAWMGNAGWMAWNLILALVPALLAAGLFRARCSRGPLWWLGLVAFVAFLPNAAYVLTDVIHMPADLRAARGSLSATAGVLGVYAAFAVVGFGAYAFSIIRLGRYLRAQGATPFAAGAVEVALHSLCTVGIFLGRVFRFNSWDLFTNPGEVFGAVHVPPTPRAVFIIGFLFVALLIGTLLVRALVLVVEEWRGWNRSASSGIAQA
jgi:uncharacterized membrane protein